MKASLSPARPRPRRGAGWGRGPAGRRARARPSRPGRGARRRRSSRATSLVGLLDEGEVEQPLARVVDDVDHQARRSGAPAALALVVDLEAQLADPVGRARPAPRLGQRREVILVGEARHRVVGLGHQAGPAQAPLLRGAQGRQRVQAGGSTSAVVNTVLPDRARPVTPRRTVGWTRRSFEASARERVASVTDLTREPARAAKSVRGGTRIRSRLVWSGGGAGSGLPQGLRAPLEGRPRPAGARPSAPHPPARSPRRRGPGSPAARRARPTTSPGGRARGAGWRGRPP